MHTLLGGLKSDSCGARGDVHIFLACASWVGIFGVIRDTLQQLALFHACLEVPYHGGP